MPSVHMQLSLFDDSTRQVLSAAGFVASMKLAMRRAVESSGLSREQVVDAMNNVVRSTGKGLCKGIKFITLPTLEKWLADGERGQLPDLWGLHVLMLACGSEKMPLEVWLSFFGCSVLDAGEREKLEYADLVLRKKSQDKRQRELEAKLLESKK